MPSSTISSLTLVALGVLVLASETSGAEEQWRIHAFGALFPYAGNVEFSAPAWEWGGGIGRSTVGGGGWLLSFSRLTPNLKDSDKLQDARMNFAWLQRTAELKVWRQPLRLAAGPGIGIYVRRIRDKPITLGTPAFAADGSWRIAEWGGAVVEVGVGVRLNMIPGSEYELNRFIYRLSVGRAIATRIRKEP